MFKLKLPTEKGKTVVVLDIGSSSVGGAIAYYRTTGEMCILYSTRKQIDIPKNYKTDQVFACMLVALGDVLSDILIHSEALIDSFYCSLASPWYSATIQTIHIEQEKPVEVTARVIDMLVGTEIKSFKSLIRSQDHELGALEVVDAHTIQMKLNGYETSNPYNKTAQTIEAVLFISLARKKILDAVQTSILKLFPQHDISFSAFPLAAFSVTRDMFEDVHNFLFIDVMGECTDISLVKQNAIRKISSFPKGKNFFIRYIAKKLHTTSEEVQTLFNLENKKTSKAPHTSVFNTTLAQAIEEWSTSFTASLEKFSDELSIPSKIFFVAHPDIAPFIEKAFQKSNLTGIMLVGSAFHTKYLKADIFEAFCASPRHIKKDPFLAINALFYQKILENKHEKAGGGEYYGRFTH